MSAATQMRHVSERGGSCCDRAGLGYILAGTKWYRGTVIVGHGNRMMAYPTGGFNNANTAAAGGPLQVAGANANGGLRFIAKQPGVEYIQTAAGAGTAITSLTVTDSGSLITIAVAANLSTTAATVVAALRANAETAALLDVVATGTGLGAIADSAGGVAASIPFVRLLGLANGDVDASADGTDQAIDDPTSYPYTVRVGELGLEMDAAFSLPGLAYVTDNQTLTQNYAALKLPVFVPEVEDGLAYARIE